MKKLTKQLKKAFTLIELVVVIAVIAILSSVSVVAYVGITNSAKQRACDTEAAQLKTLFMSEDISNNSFSISGNKIRFEKGYSWAQIKRALEKEDSEFANLLANANPSEDGTKLIYSIEKNSTVLFEFAEKVKQWDEIKESTVNFGNLVSSDIGNEPFGLKLSYYSDIYSRGFLWATNKTILDSKLYIIEDNQSDNPNFPESSLIEGTSTESTKIIVHKAYIEGLKPATTYKYKVGSSSGWEYGTFKTEALNPTSFTGIALSDAQTKEIDSGLLKVWENTFAQAVETAGNDINSILYGGDQYNSGSFKGNDEKLSSLAHIETIQEYLGTTPYMAIGGNHDYDDNYYDVNNIKFFNEHLEDKTGAYYSYNYGKIHFIHLETGAIKNSKISAESEQVKWLKNDLQKANQDNSRWIIVSMHNGLFSTGDHSNDTVTQTIVEQLAPLFSQYHVDLVLQAHDHTFCKTLPYKWDSTGYTELQNDSQIVNLNPIKSTLNGISYDKNPNGTYYVTTGAAGHRFGESEKDAGIWAELNGNQPLLDKVGFTYNKYKTEVGKITQSNSYSSFSAKDTTISQATLLGLKSTDKFDYTSPQIYTANVSNASANVNANMFGILNIKDNTLRYDFYTVVGNDVKLFDSLNIMKTSN